MNRYTGMFPSTGMLSMPRRAALAACHDGDGWIAVRRPDLWPEHNTDKLRLPRRLQGRKCPSQWRGRKQPQYSGFSGSGYVAQLDQPGDFIEFSVSVPREDYYTLRFRYLNRGRSPAIRTLFLNGVQVPGATDFRNVYDQKGSDSSGQWANVDEALRMSAGMHSIRLAY
jgi:hypothetical protein